MNCKPGDLAIIIGHSKHAGRLVEVLFAAPIHDFLLPDGDWHLACPSGYWCLRSLGTPFDLVIRMPWGTTTSSGMYVAGADAWLRPLRGESECSDGLMELSLDAQK